MYEIKKIKSWPFCLIAGIAGVVLSFIATLLFFLFLLLVDELDFLDILDYPEELLIPLGITISISGIGFFLIFLVGSLIYNFIASRFRGIQLEISYRKQPAERNN